MKAKAGFALFGRALEAEGWSVSNPQRAAAANEMMISAPDLILTRLCPVMNARLCDARLT
ncbi:hypothetical protein [Bradyrhizobium sp.]